MNRLKMLFAVAAIALQPMADSPALAQTAADFAVGAQYDTTHWTAFSHGAVTSDVADAPGAEIGKPGTTYRRIRITSPYGKMTVSVTDGALPWPYGLDLAGYEVADLDATLAKAAASGASVLTKPSASTDRRAAVVRFPGGYIAEIHAPLER